ncbi:Kelch repeat-containing protein [Thalassotalea sp. PS06]|uniref:Kelch repeat-containing protein n=1 Tax=Thalassotalea sp. PS06 TaxID=2594005 RepID=UPI0011647757|nr:kelch repeat-containing protein [Thalassotalea sp. PS06]QDP03051.1 galactose oxidase [Thalassotalea sp. PS06]
MLVASRTVFAGDHLNIPPLPEPVANNAVAKVINSDGEYLLSFMGLGAGKTYKDVHNKAFALKLGDSKWKQISSVPATLKLPGRLASVAVGVNEYAYIFGGYTVAEDHQEISSPDVFRYDISNDRYERLAPMPVPVDDSVALVYKQRYIYLISGWHNAGNVNLVQIYDIVTDTWQQGSPFLGQAVFGQAGAISGEQMIICDGVKVVPREMQRRVYAAVAQCLIGKIDANDPLKIDWRLLPHPTSIARYRMAAASLNGDFVFIGGSDNPYNYNGIGYDGNPSKASSDIWVYSLQKNAWQVIGAGDTDSVKATMDHRGLLTVGRHLLTIGGMNSEQQVLSDVVIRDIGKH